MIFISTCSQDKTTDIVMQELDPNDVLRFNIDKPEYFAWDFHANGFRVADKVSGKEITDKTLTSFYLRKPMYFDLIDVPKFGCVENWRREETDELFNDFFRECQSRGLTALVRSQNNKYGKLRQLLVAKRHFRVAPWHIFHGELPEELKRGRWVVKALTQTPIGKGKVFFVKEVVPSALDLSYPWFVQERIAGEEEVTVVYIDGKTYAANAPRDSFGGEDSRKALFVNPISWPCCELSPEDERAIRGFMDETGYRFGRFDFIRKDGELWFLELNPNGQWAWLDEKNEHGLVSMVADAIKAEDQAHRENPSRR
ncbi:MAG: hypothetical protein IKO72_14175 [Kiritimatiellae bacterium]|nr:hypothetical protein [Kiritimatiellia bacterium]